MSVLSRTTAAPTPAQLTALLDSADEALLLVDARARIGYCNHAAIRLFGCEAGQSVEPALARLAEPARSELLRLLIGAERAVDRHWIAPLVDGPSLRLALAIGTGGQRMLRAQPHIPAAAASRAVGEPVTPVIQRPVSPLGREATSEIVRLLWDSPQPLTVQDQAFRIVAANRAYCQASGQTQQALLGRDPAEFTPSEDHADLQETRRQLLTALAEGRQPDLLLKQRMVDASGHERWFRQAPRWISADDGTPLLLSLQLDATLEHRARAQADRSAFELEQWFDLSPVGMLVYDHTGLIVRSNAAFQALIGRAPVSLHDAPPELCRLLGWDEAGLHAEVAADAPTLEVRGSLQAADGRHLRLRSRLRAFRSHEAASLRVMAVLEDRSLEDERDLARLEMGALMGTTGIGVATYEASRGWLQGGDGFNDARPALPGGLQAIGRNQVEPGSREEFDRLQLALREGRQAQVRYAVNVPPQGMRWLLTRVEPGQLDGGRNALSVVTLDITEQEEAHRRSELMFNLSDVGIAYVREGRIARANAALAQLAGYTALGELALAELFGEAASREILLAAPPAAAGADRPRRFAGERLLRRRDGSQAWVQVSTRAVDEADPDAGLICSCVDIDERRRAREAMQLQTERTRAILDSVLVGIVTVGERGIEWMNRSARRMFGGELADFVGEPIDIVATPEPDHPLRAQGRLRALAEGQSETFECRLRGRDGREFWVVGNAVLTGREASGGQITFALLDIERRRQAEVSIAQAQASLQRIIETAPLAIALFDGLTLQVLRLNQMAAMFFGRPVQALLGRTLAEVLDGDDARSLETDLRQALQQTEVLRRELTRDSHASGGGEPRAWDVRVVTLGSAAEPQLLLVASDVTEQRAAEQARFEAAVSQREMLVKEVHHRIKNNLQGVAGLLQQTAARRPEVATLIREAVGQVQAIAQVHGLQVGGAGPLRVQPLVEAITQAVQRTFGRAIEVVTAGDAAHRYALPEAESIPIALTINELLTNAIKHGTAGDIRCLLHFAPERLTITVINPGTVREGFSLAAVAPGVSGLGLVRALLPRRSATLTLGAEAGQVRAEVVLVPPSVTLLEPL